MSTLSAPAGGDHNRASELNSIGWTFLSLSAVFLCLRFYSRIRLTRNIWWDDWFILLAWILTLIYTGLLSYMASLGGCRHLYYLAADPAQASKAIRINWITQPFTIMALVAGKIAVAFLILRIMGRSFWRRLFLIYAAMILSVIIGGIAIVLTFAQCRPVQALWKPELVAQGKAHCWPPSRQTDFSVFGGSWLAFMDLALAALPVTIVWKLQLSWQKKVGLAALMGMGVFACICAAIKTAKLPELTARSDITYITVTLWIWNSIESNVVIVAACIPTLRPLFLILLHKPGRSNYIHSNNNRKAYPSISYPIPSDDSTPGGRRSYKISPHLSDSTTAVGERSEDDGVWMELGPDQRRGGGGGGGKGGKGEGMGGKRGERAERITKTMDVDVLSQVRGGRGVGPSVEVFAGQAV